MSEGNRRVIRAAAQRYIVVTHGGAEIGAFDNASDANLFAAAPELLEQARLFARCLDYEIKKSESEGDDEGANLKRVTLNLCNTAIAKAEGR